MPPTIGGVGIDPQGQTVVVTITPAAKVYTDAAGTTLATFPQTISSVTKWYVTAAQEFTVSALIDGVEAASGTGTTRVVNIEQGEMQVISVTVDHPGEESSHSHAYASYVDAYPSDSPKWQALFNECSYEHSIISFRHDDCPAQDITVLDPLYTARGFVAGYAVNIGRVGTVNGSITYLTAAQMLTLQQHGHEIMNHSRSHGVDPTTWADFVDEAITCNADIAAAVAGLQLPHSFVQPGTWTVTAADAATGGNFNTVASVETPRGRKLQQYYAAFFGYVPSMQPDSFYTLPSGRKYGILHWTPATSVATFQRAIDRAVEVGARLEVLVHSLQLDTTGFPTTVGYGQMLDYVKTATDAGVMTNLTPTGSLYAKLRSPRINIAPDPSFTSPATVADSGWGQNGTPTIVVGGGVLSNRNAVSLNSANNISRAWRCAEMRSVAMRCKYKSAAAGVASNVRLQTYSRDPDGSTQYGFQQSAVLASTDSWQTSPWLTMGCDSRAQDYVTKFTSTDVTNFVLVTDIEIVKL